MSANKETKTERLSSRVTASLKNRVLKFARDESRDPDDAVRYIVDSYLDEWERGRAEPTAKFIQLDAETERMLAVRAELALRNPDSAEAIATLARVGLAHLESGRMMRDYSRVLDAAFGPGRLGRSPLAPASERRPGRGSKNSRRPGKGSASP